MIRTPAAAAPPNVIGGPSSDLTRDAGGGAYCFGGGSGSRTGGGRSLSRIAVRVRMRAASWRVGEFRQLALFAQPKSGYGGVRFCGHCADNYWVIFLIVP
jgi:hypothetical protein